jgi:TFIIF-interacting CTD phosphatase-like protein
MPTVVLDLDSTLVYSRQASITEDLEEDERNFYIRPIFGGAIYKVTKRKHLDFFLDELKKKKYKVIVWSAGGSAYVKDVVSVLFRGREDQILVVLTSVHLTEGRKNLKTIDQHAYFSFRPEDTRLVDDNEDHALDQEDLFIKIEPFVVEGDDVTEEEDDDVLETLIERIDKSFGRA